METIKNSLLKYKGDIIFIIVIAIISITLSSNLAILYIQGNSMYPTYEDGNVVLLKKNDVVNMEDLVVFNSPDSWDSGGAKYIKRVIAGEGDSIEITNIDVRVNGEILSELNFQCNSDNTSTMLKEGEYIVMGDNIGASNDSVSQYCLGNDEFIIKEKDLIVYGEELLTLGGIR